MADQFFRFRLDSDMRRLLDRLRDEKDINLSRWVQRQVRNALGREFPDREATETPKKPPIANTETREPEPPQTPTIGTREVPEPGHATAETPNGSMADQFFRFRLDSDMRRLLDRLRDEKDINLSRWVQRQVRNALGREFPDREATETPKKPPIANTETREPEPPQTPTIGTREVPESGHATAETPKKPPIANTETREPEPPQTPTIGTREVPESGHATAETPKKPPIANTETREPEPPQTPTIGTREVPEPGHATTETPKKPPIDGWKPQRLDSGEWGAVLDGELVAELPDSDQLPGTAISVTDSKGDSWTTTIVAVVNRSDADIVVTNAGRPRD